jgi:diguanylate cyclase (GGDEF)-like protein
MCSDRLRVIAGEFAAPEREAAFQSERLSETRRHARLTFFVAAFVYMLIIVSDWHYADRETFWDALPLRLTIIATSLGSCLAARHVATFSRLQNILLAWSAITTAAVTALCALRPAVAPFVTLTLPALYLLVLPMRFWWTLTSALACAAALLSLQSVQSTLVALAVPLIVVDVALTVLLVRGNRLRRMEWAAVEAGRRANESLAESRRLFETMFKAVPIPIVVSRQADGRIMDANDAAFAFFGFPRQADLSTIRTHDVIGPAERRLVQNHLDDDGLVQNLEVSVNGIGGERHDVLLSVAKVDVGGSPCTISSLVDITHRKIVEERIWQAAHHDALTGLPNRALFQATLETAISRAQATGSSLGLILVDLDAFKEINDALGHDAGDVVLKEAARRLKSVAGAGDLVARLGGDEFVVVVSGDGSTDGIFSERLQALAEKILDVLDPALPLNGRLVAPRASLGLAVFPDHGHQSVDLFTNADLALYASKGAGRRRATLFVPSLRVETEARGTIAREMRVALDEGGLVPFYQPKIELRDGQVVGFEALARWQHPSRGLLTPADFMSAFDDPEIGAAVGHCLLRRICADVAGWLAQGLDPGRVFLNLSSAQFAQDDLARTIFDEIARAGLNPDRIGIEVTETVLLGGHGDRVAPVLDALHAGGLSIALDDFGTGYASLTHLKQFPVSEIKVDRSFVRDLERDADDAAIVTAVLHLGRSLGLDVTAEGVETPAQARFLEKQGCAYAQGYLYSKPMPPSRVPWFLKNRPDLAFDMSLPTGELKIA